MKDDKILKEKENIVFLESEIIDDDDTAPFGVIVGSSDANSPVRADIISGKAAQTAKNVSENEIENNAAADDTVFIVESATEANGVLNEKRADTDKNLSPAPAPITEAEETSIKAKKPSSGNAPSPIDDPEMNDGSSFEENFFADVPETGKDASEGSVSDNTQTDAAVLSEAAADMVQDDKNRKADKQAKQTVDVKGTDTSADVWQAAKIKPAKKAAATKKTAPEEENMSAKVKQPAAKVKTAAKETNKSDSAKKAAVSDKPATKSTDVKSSAKSAAKTSKPTDKTAASKTTVNAARNSAANKSAVKKAESSETILVPGDDSIPHGRFVIKKSDKGNFLYKLYSYNHRVVAIGAEPYSSLATCKTGIMSVMKNAEHAPIEDQTLRKWEEQKCPKWQIYEDKKGEIRLRLLASNGNIVATTNDGYLSKDAAKNGIEAIGRASKGAEIVRNDDLW